jgi:hypothetical protein
MNPEGVVLVFDEGHQNEHKVALAPAPALCALDVDTVEIQNDPLRTLERHQE